MLGMLAKPPPSQNSLPIAFLGDFVVLVTVLLMGRRMGKATRHNLGKEFKYFIDCYCLIPPILLFPFIVRSCGYGGGNGKWGNNEWVMG
jgi:hypothetical protein